MKDLEEGRANDFRMTIRGKQRTFHSDKTKISGRAKELELKGYYIIKMGANGHLTMSLNSSCHLSLSQFAKNNSQ